MSDSSSNTMPPPGTISWTEIPAIDLARAQKFYGDLFGWTFTTFPTASVCPDTGKPAESNYVMFAKGAMHGGFVKVEKDHHISPSKKPYDEAKGVQTVTVTITVESVDETLKAIEKAGGEVYMTKMKIPGDNMGYNAYFLDSEKNVMGVWSMN